MAVNHYRTAAGKDNTIFIISSVIMALVAAYVMPVRNAVMLRWMEEMSYSDPSSYHLDLMLKYPGGLLQIIGTWLTQFMYYPWIGFLILLLIWGVIVYLSVRVFQLGKALLFLSLVPPCALAVSILKAGTIWMMMPVEGYVYSQSAGLMIILILFFGFRKIPGNGAKALISLVAPLLFPLLGFYALLLWLLTAISIFPSEFNKENLAVTVILFMGLLLAIAAPFVYYYNWNGTWVELRWIWFRGLPDALFVSEIDNAAIRIAFGIMTGAIILMAVLSRTPLRKTGSRSAIATGLLFDAAMLVWLLCSAAVPESFRALLLMERYMEEGKWSRIMAVMDNTRERPSREMTLINHMAEAVLNANPSGRMPVADNDTLKPGTYFMRTALISVPLNHYLGKYNLSYRWAMEHSVKTGRRVFYLKYMVRNALNSYEPELAARYLDMLATTIFHREWAERYRHFVDNPALINDSPELRTFKDNAPEGVFY